MIELDYTQVRTIAGWMRVTRKSRPTIIKMIKSGLIPAQRDCPNGHWYTPPLAAKAWDEGRWMRREVAPVEIHRQREAKAAVSNDEAA